MPTLLVIEDGHEYEEFARLFLAASYDVVAAHSCAEALTRAADGLDDFVGAHASHLGRTIARFDQADLGLPRHQA